MPTGLISGLRFITPMTKIVVDLPDWVFKEERGIYILAGIEQVAYKMPWEDDWHVKTSRCSKCGKCCKAIECEFLENNLCSKGLERPFICCIAENKEPKRTKFGCTVRFD